MISVVISLSILSMSVVMSLRVMFYLREGYFYFRLVGLKFTIKSFSWLLRLTIMGNLFIILFRGLMKNF